MRIIAGKYKNRNLYTLEGPNTRPTTSRNKDSLFNIIGPFFDGGNSLDMFGGSGALTIESLSRGISHAVIGDKSIDAIKIIKKNLELVKASSDAEVYKIDYMNLLKLMAKEGRSFDLILVDPPFAMLCVDEIIEFIDEHNMLNPDGVIMAEYYKDNSFKKEFNHIYEYRFLDRGTSHISLYTLKDEEGDEQ